MPLFDFRCNRCSHVFEELVQGEQQVKCPHCGAPAPEKLLATFAVGSGQPDTPCDMGPCGPACDPGGPTCSQLGQGTCGLN